MLVLHLHQVEVYKREHENTLLDSKKNIILKSEQEADDFFSQNFQPLNLKISEFRVLCVRSCEWEAKEDLF